MRPARARLVGEGGELGGGGAHRRAVRGQALEAADMRALAHRVLHVGQGSPQMWWLVRYSRKVPRAWLGSQRRAQVERRFCHAQSVYVAGSKAWTGLRLFGAPLQQP